MPSPATLRVELAISDHRGYVPPVLTGDWGVPPARAAVLSSGLLLVSRRRRGGGQPERGPHLVRTAANL
jgi:hypothetical protein